VGAGRRSLADTKCGAIVANTSWARIFTISALTSDAFPELRTDFRIRVLVI
jgi:hypothetical protein